MPPFEISNPNAASKPGLPSVQDLNIDPTRDTYVIRGAGGNAVAHVKKPDGRVFTARVLADGALQQFTTFDPGKLTVPERRQLEHDLYTKNRLRQTEIADLLGVSQATVANDLKIVEKTNN